MSVISRSVNKSEIEELKKVLSTSKLLKNTKNRSQKYMEIDVKNPEKAKGAETYIYDDQEKNTLIGRIKHLFIVYNENIQFELTMFTDKDHEAHTIVVDLWLVSKNEGKLTRTHITYANDELIYKNQTAIDSVQPIEVSSVYNAPQIEDSVSISQNSGSDPVPCFDASAGFSGQCCVFCDTAGNCTEYNYCGADCGNGLSDGSGISVNALDSCCVGHDSCYNYDYTSYPGRCNCDQDLIDCARRVRDVYGIVGSGDIILAFQAKMTVNFCSFR